MDSFDDIFQRSRQLVSDGSKSGFVRSLTLKPSCLCLPLDAVAAIEAEVLSD